MTHDETVGSYSYYGPYGIKRSLYMDDVLYTVSNKMIKMNDLNDLGYINGISFPYSSGNYYRYGWS